MKKIIFFAAMFLSLSFAFSGCSLMEMTSDQRKAFYADCAKKGLLVQITVDPVNSEQVTVKCVPRFIFEPVPETTPPPAVVGSLDLG